LLGAWIAPVCSRKEIFDGRSHLARRDAGVCAGFPKAFGLARPTRGHKFVSAIKELVDFRVDTCNLGFDLIERHLSHAHDGCSWSAGYCDRDVMGQKPNDGADDSRDYERNHDSASQFFLSLCGLFQSFVWSRQHVPSDLRIPEFAGMINLVRSTVK
jgi:hypothetical protein